MSQAMNFSSEMTQPNNPISCYVNSSMNEDTPVNSFCSPRAGSVTVVGKRIFSHSCISPTVIEEIPRFPIPIKVITRIKRHNHQAKKLLKQKSSKIKCPEQPAPPVQRSQPRPMPPPVKKRESVAERHKPIPKPVVKVQPKEEPKPPAPLNEKSTVKLSKIIKKSVKLQVKYKKKIEIEKRAEFESKTHRKLQLQKRNSKIRQENSTRFKKEKFSPKIAWGIDERKYTGIERQKILIDIEKQRNARRELKKSPGYLSKKALGLSKLLEIEQELGFKPRSSSMVAEPPTESVRKIPDPTIKLYINEQRKKFKASKTMNLIEDIKKETLRMTNLKLLDVKSQVNSKALKKKPRKLKKNFSTGKVKILNKDSDEEIIKCYDEKYSSDFVFEPDSALKQGISEFTEETEPLEQVDNLEKVKERAAVLIQAHIRGFLVRKSLKPNDSFYQEDFEVQKIINTWQQNLEEAKKTEATELGENHKSFDPQQLIDLEQMRQDELNEVVKVAKSHTKYPEVLESLSKMIEARYQNIAEMLQVSNEINLDEKVEEERFLNFSFPSYASEKESEEKSPCNSEKELEVSEQGKDSEARKFQEFEILSGSFEDIEDLTLSAIKEVPKAVLISRASPISDISDAEDRNQNPKEITADFILETSEVIIKRLLSEAIAENNSSKIVKVIDKDSVNYVNRLSIIIERNFKEFYSKISEPIRFNPLETLYAVQKMDEGLCLDVYSFPEILTHSQFEELSKDRIEGPSEELLKYSQSAHDQLLFDNCNEILQNYRPYGIHGDPTPWSCHPRLIGFIPSKFSEILPELIKELEHRSRFSEGKINDIQLIVNSEGNEVNREEIIGKLLTCDIREKEYIWIQYEFHETQTGIELADLILEILTLEAVNLLEI